MRSSSGRRKEAVPGAGTVFALRAIGILLAARWLNAMAALGYSEVGSAIASSPAALLHLLFLFLLVVLPGADPSERHPFHPLPRWLRQALRLLGGAAFLFAVFSVFVFSRRAGLLAAWQALRSSNGWLILAPLSYLAVVWLCRPRPLWPTHPNAGRFALGRFGVEIDAQATAVVWDQNRRVGRYAASELRLLLPQSRHERIILLWESLAAVGHNKTRVFSVRARRRSDRDGARALATALERTRGQGVFPSLPAPTAGHIATGAEREEGSATPAGLGGASKAGDVQVSPGDSAV